jgi:integrase
MQKLTADFIDALAANGKDQAFSDTVVSGLSLRVTQAGQKLFIAKARVGGKLRKVTLGSYPGMSLAAARREARPALDALRLGRDPSLEKAARQKTVADGAVTIEALADRWLTDQVRVKRKPRTVADYEKIFAQHINPALGHLPVQAITWADVNAFHGSMARTPRRANYVVSTLRACLTYSEKIGLRPPLTNPCRGIEFFREKARERFLSEAEIAQAGEAIEAVERKGTVGPHGAAGLRLALFTGARSGEVTAIQWSHIDWQRRIVRLPDSKTNEPRTIHLSDAAVEFLKTLPRVGRFVIAGAKPDEPYKNLGRAWIIAREVAGLQDVRLHDLRHSYASLAAGRGVSLQMIGKLLGHKVPATTARYAHLAKDAVAAVNDELGTAMMDAMAKGAKKKTANVVKLRQPRKPRSRP